MMTDPIEAPVQQPAPDDAVHLDHIICASCYAEGHRLALCGTPMTMGDEVVSIEEPIVLPPCVVCHSAPLVWCNRCGEEIETR